MIRLIVSDMDGTLLDNQKNIPNGFFDMVHALHQRGIVFAAASGRSYPKMRKDFEKALKEMYFICDNGAVIWYQDRILYQNPLPREGVRKISDELEKMEGIMPIFCGANGAWYQQCPNEYRDAVSSYYINQHIVNSYGEIDDDIMKIAICDHAGPENNSYKQLYPLYGNQYHMAISGTIWMDIMNFGVNKGVAVKKIQQLLNVPVENTMAFGDFYNDTEMLLQAEHSYVMENANLDMRKYAKFIAPSNQNNGVMQVIYQQIFGRTVMP